MCPRLVSAPRFETAADHINISLCSLFGIRIFVSFDFLFSFKIIISYDRCRTPATLFYFMTSSCDCFSIAGDQWLLSLT